MNTQSLVNYAEMKIREMIINGDLSLGQKITEEQLADHFSISTTPIHEALKVLSKVGIVTIKPRSGTYVTSFTKQEIEDLNSVRIVIECEAIRESMQKNFKKLCDDLKFNILDAKETMRTVDTKKYISIDNKFHALFFTHAKNEFLNITFNPIEAKVFTLYNRQINNYTKDDIEISVNQHNGIYRAIKDNNFDLAYKNLKEHILRINNYDP
ncbi:GntR family transcriptional regulator [Telmatospirillum sp.]|uniref:GntR family transcriptional regulator n=1 Tax=Telmatospirillum sp. TaxID=2079197 RepID=UPI00283D583A|nr:GntR family transcriptional regulator [Telmatospirillum sp.]MDR3438312.1 GntR family transcriptional regulator [Telmatospirillum sp.]